MLWLYTFHNIRGGEMIIEFNTQLNIQHGSHTLFYYVIKRDCSSAFMYLVKTKGSSLGI